MQVDRVALRDLILWNDGRVARLLSAYELETYVQVVDERREQNSERGGHSG